MAETDTVPRDFATLKARSSSAARIAEAAEPDRRLRARSSRRNRLRHGRQRSPTRPRCSPPTLVRFSQAMGYQGFSELQEVFRARLRDRVLNYEERIAQLREHGQSASKAHGLCSRVSPKPAQNSVADLHDKLDPDSLDRAVGIGWRRRDDLSPGAAALVSRSPPTWPMPSASSASAMCWSTAGRPGADRSSFVAPQGRRAGGELHALCQRDGDARRGREGAACRSSPSPTPPFPRWRARPKSGSRSPRRISRASARWPRAWRSP